jgi:hypothetical protein
VYDALTSENVRNDDTARAAFIAQKKVRPHWRTFN